MNPYTPFPAEIEEVRAETPDIKTFRLKIPQEFTYKPGQFVEVSVFGVGEAPISITSNPNRKGILELSVKKIGAVSSALHNLEAGDFFYIRGPYGNGFPIEELEKKDVLFVGGGVGLPPLRSLINFMLDDRKSYGRIILLYGARTRQDLAFKEELDAWSKGKHVEVHVTVDRGDDHWTGNVGVVPKLLDNVRLDNAKETYAVVCGPGVMIKFTVKGLLEKGFAEEKIILSMERMMKCGVGKCGHCGIGDKYTCIDGPVFKYSELKKNIEFKF